MSRAVLFRIEPRGPVGNDHILVTNCRCLGAAQRALHADARANSMQSHRISFAASYSLPSDALRHLERVHGYAFAIDGGDPPPEPDGVDRWT